MKSLVAVLLILFHCTSILSQHLQIEGKVRIDSMNKDNNADSVVVRLDDGTLAVRDVSSLTTETGWIMDSDTTSTLKLVGIGTSSPDQQLHVLGNQKIEGRLEIIKSNGDSSVFIGINAGINDDGDNENTFIGHDAGKSNIDGFFNTATGAGALQAVVSGSYNSATGAGALFTNNLGYSNTATGVAALYDNTTGYENTANGVIALENNTTGFRNTATGIRSLNVNTEGSFNTANGAAALFLNTTGSYNTASGVDALRSNMTGSSNTAIGVSSLNNNNIGFQNSAVGRNALYSNTEGHANTAMGTGALNNNTIGHGNTAIGVNALPFNSSGGYNTAIGVAALYKDTTGSYNTSMGISALYSNTMGNWNTAVGDSALWYNDTGDKNTALGAKAGVLADDLENTTALGYNAQVTMSNMIRIGNDSVLIIEGQVPYSSSSDRRLKEDIVPVRLGLEFIRDLKPVQYHRINNSQNDLEMGIIAQDIVEILEKHGADQLGIVNQKEDDYLSVRYNDLIAPLIKAVQELSAQNELLQADLNHFKSEIKRINDLEAELAQLKVRIIQANQSDSQSMIELKNTIK